VCGISISAAGAAPAGRVAAAGLPDAAAAAAAPRPAAAHGETTMGALGALRSTQVQAHFLAVLL
jgi:hypothetical protein